MSGVRVSPSVQTKNNMVKYIKESFEELSNHVSWLEKDEAQKSTVVVAVFTIIFAIAVFAVDYVFQLGLDNFFIMFNN